MYCSQCYAELPAEIFGNCPQCGRGFDERKPDTMLSRPFPGTKRILQQLLYTTIVGVVIALIIGNFQLARGSGH